MTHPTFELPPYRVSELRTRAPSQRTDPPRVDEVLYWRAQAGGAVVRARVLRVDTERPADTRAGAQIDWNVWRYKLRGPGLAPREDALGNREIELVDDPWWNVLLVTLDGPKIWTETREARLPGGAGWLRGKE